MKIETNLVASDLSQCDPVAIEIPHSEWQCLKEFFRLAEKLRASRFVREGRGGSIGFSWKPGEGILAKSKEIEEEPVLAMLLLLRPFILNRERSFLPKIVKLLKRRLEHSAFRRHLDELNDYFFLKTMESRFLLRGTGRPPLSHAVVMDWLNSFQYHFDSEKRVKVLEDLGPFADFQDGMNVALFSLVDMVQAILGVSDVIKTLELCADGTIPEIECPPTYFDQRFT